MICNAGTDAIVPVARVMGGPMPCAEVQTIVLMPCAEVHTIVALLWLLAGRRLGAIVLTARTVLFGNLEDNGNRIPDKGDCGLGVETYTVGLALATLFPATVEVAR
jgi:hypothetical protein